MSIPTTFNRTSLELKLPIAALFPSMEIQLLIEPVWN